MQQQLDSLKNENLEEKCNNLQKELWRLQQQCWQKQVKERQKQQDMKRQSLRQEQKARQNYNMIIHVVHST